MIMRIMSSGNEKRCWSNHADQEQLYPFSFPFCFLINFSYFLVFFFTLLSTGSSLNPLQAIFCCKLSDNNEIYCHMISVSHYLMSHIFIEYFCFNRWRWIDFSVALLAFVSWHLQDVYAMMQWKRWNSRAYLTMYNHCSGRIVKIHEVDLFRSAC